MIVSDRVQWDRTTDVVIVGLGAAGAVAAITARDKGAKVLVLEKQPAASHISTSGMSGGLFICPTNVRDAVAYMTHISKVDEALSWTDDDMISVWAEYACQNLEWAEKMGASNIEVFDREGEHKVPGQNSIIIYRFAGKGPGMMRFLISHVETRDIPVMYDTAANKILTNLHNEVLGVRCVNQGKEINVRAQRAVIMCPGGFEYNEAMKLNYIKVYPTYFTGHTSATGDGFPMVQDVGASLWHMNCCSASWALKFPEMPIAMSPNFRGSRTPSEWAKTAVTGSPYGYFVVDRDGKRYTNEEYKRHTLYYELALYDSQRLIYPRVPSYWIFDRKRFEAGPMPLMWYGPMQVGLYRWSQDNSEELEKGYIIQAENIGKLARKLDMEPSVLRKTLQKYNKYCESGEDPEFHRPSKHLVPMKEPPFFAVKVWPGGPNTQGGPCRNHRSQVLDTENKPIPRLYAAGEFGSIYGLLYPAAGGNLAECIAFGRIAGENAASA